MRARGAIVALASKEEAVGDQNGQAHAGVRHQLVEEINSGKSDLHRHHHHQRLQSI